jgi:FtsP/CotA-like multicopper oxidase with cupredoxin domain
MRILIRPRRTCAVLIIVCLSACGRYEPGESPDPSLQPEVRQSVNGVLSTTLEVLIATNTVLDVDSGLQKEIETTTYEGRLIGPTLRVSPGDRLKINIVNSLPPNPDQTRKGAFPHEPYTTNLHTHGLTVSSQGMGDNPFRQMLPQTSSLFEVVIPDFHPAGTFWYHPHKHGSVAFQFFGGMAGFLIVDGGPGTIDAIPEISAAHEILMAFQAIRVDEGGKVPWLNTEATQFARNGAYSAYINSTVHLTTNGLIAPTFKMRPQEVQRWRFLSAASGMTMVITMQGAEFNIIALDGISLSKMLTLPVGFPLILGAGNRADVLVKAPAVGTYLVQAVDPSETIYSVSPQGVAPGIRTVRVGGDFPNPTYPVTLATIVVDGEALDMALPAGPLPEKTEPISTDELLAAVPNATRRVVFENCGQQGNMADPDHRLSSCQYFFEKYDADYWGGLPFHNLLMMRDADDDGIPIDPGNPSGPHTNYQKGGLFTADRSLFDDMLGGNIEEWTVINRATSDHSFHIHQNPFLLTHINGQPLPIPEWRDTILVPGATGGGGNINAATYGSVTFRTYLHPRYQGKILTHCHVLTHEDFGMMQMLEIKPGE